MGNKINENLEKFIKLREQEKEFYELCGYYNGDVTSNGELSVLEAFAKQSTYFLDVGYNSGEISKIFRSLNQKSKIFTESSPLESPSLVEFATVNLKDSLNLLPIKLASTD